MMYKNYMLLIFVLLFILFFLNSCGTIASYKTAKITRPGKPEFTVGASVQKIPFENKADNHNKKTDGSSLVQPDFAIWSRLNSSNSNYDGGINFSIPLGVQGIFRRNLIQNKSLIPEITVGILGRRYEGTIAFGDPEYFSSFIDIGIPIYLSWDVSFPQKLTFYSNFTPTLRRYKYESAFGGSTYDFEEYLYGVQFTFGFKFWNILLEHNTMPLNDNKLHMQTGIAYVF